MPLYPGDLLSHEDVIALSLPAFGAWMKTIFIMWRAESAELTKPNLNAWGRAWGCYPDVEPERVLNELRTVAKVTENGDGSVSIYSKRVDEELNVLEEKRESARERKQRWRERQQQQQKEKEKKQQKVTRSERVPNASGTRLDMTSDSDFDSDKKEKEESENFGEAWSVDDVQAIVDLYPRQVGRRKAVDAVREALERIASRKDAPPDPVEWLGDRVRQFAESPAGDKGQFTPYPNNWFDDDRFDDDPAEWTPAKPKNGSTNLLTHREALEVVHRNQGRTMKDLFRQVKQGEETLFQPIT